jgi:MOSC domain-containing protein YiiM
MNKQGIIKAVSISRRKGIPKSNVISAELIKDFGIENDAHAGKWHRQVSFLAMESIDKMKTKGLPKLRPGAFAENITTEFIDVPNLTIGSRLQIGKDAKVEITQIGKECHSKCAIFYRAGTCVMPTDGIFGIVTKSGKIFVNDKIEVL